MSTISTKKKYLALGGNPHSILSHFRATSVFPGNRNIFLSQQVIRKFNIIFLYFFNKYLPQLLPIPLKAHNSQHYSSGIQYKYVLSSLSNHFDELDFTTMNTYFYLSIHILLNRPTSKTSLHIKSIVNNSRLSKSYFSYVRAHHYEYVNFIF